MRFCAQAAEQREEDRRFTSPRYYRIYGVIAVVFVVLSCCVVLGPLQSFQWPGKLPSESQSVATPVGVTNTQAVPAALTAFRVWFEETIGADAVTTRASSEKTADAVATTVQGPSEEGKDAGSSVGKWSFQEIVDTDGTALQSPSDETQVEEAAGSVPSNETTETDRTAGSLPANETKEADGAAGPLPSNKTAETDRTTGSLLSNETTEADGIAGPLPSNETAEVDSLASNDAAEADRTVGSLPSKQTEGVEGIVDSLPPKENVEAAWIANSLRSGETTDACGPAALLPSEETIVAYGAEAPSTSQETVEGDAMLVQVPSEKAVEADASWGLRKKPGIPEEFQGGKFFMYDGPEFDFFDAIELYKKTHRGRNIWENEKKDTVQDTGEIWLYRYLAEHPARTLDPEEADLFYVPALLATSFRMWSQGFAYRRRIENMTQALMELPYLRRHQGADHLYVCSWWRCGAALRPLNALVEASATSLLVTMERFERWSHWKCPERLVVVPYVADINVTRHYSLTPFSERSISFLFVGCSRYRPERASMKGLRDINASYIRVPSNCEKFSVRPEDYAGLIMDSKFCLVPRGDTYTTRRLFDAVAAGCIPLIQDGGIRRSLPFVWKLDYSQFALFAPTRVFRKSADLLAHCSELLERPEAEFDQMQRVLFRVRDELVWGRGDPFGAAENLGSVGDNVLYEAMWKSSRLKRRGNVTTAPCLANWPQPNQ